MSDQIQTLDGLKNLTLDVNLPTLSGKLLRVARAGWLGLFCLAIGIMITAIPGYMAKFQGQLAHASPEQLGASVTIFAAASGIASLISAFLSLGLAYFLFRRKFTESAAAAIAYYLLVYGIVMAGPLEFWGSYWLGTAAFATTVQAILMATPTIALFALFPNGRFVPAWMRYILIISIPWSISLIFLGPFNGTQLEALGVMFTVVAILFSAFILVGIYAQVYRFLRVSTPTERQQTKWVVLGFVLWFLWIVVSTGPYMYLTALPPGSTPPWWAPISELGWWLSLVLVPASLTIAITRYRLWNIDIVINRTLVFGSVTLLSIGLYTLVIAGLGFLFQSTESIVIPLIATGVAVLTFQPMRSRMQATVNRMMYGERDDPVSLINKLGEQLEHTATPQATLQGIVETVAQALKLPYVGIIQGQDEQAVAIAGTESDETLRFPLIYQGQEVGTLEIAPRAPGVPLTPKDLILLESITRQASAVAYNAHLTSDLLLARQRLVAAREEERRRIRRDLHDGLGPQLASLTLKLDASRNLLEDKPRDVARLLSESKEQVQDAVADIRRLVYDLRPPALDELGLMSTLREQATTFSTTKGHQVYIEGPENLPNLPAAVEVAVYRIVQEGLKNASQHGDAKHCWVRIRDDNGLNLEIEDDGSGFPANYRSGVGIASMRERTSELGGKFEIGPGSSGGTRISAWLPL